MRKRLTAVTIAFAATLLAPILAAPMASALPVEPCTIDYPENCPGGDPGDPGGGYTPPPPPPAPTYQLTGTLAGIDVKRNGPLAWVQFRGVSKFKNSNGSNVDADHLAVTCQVIGNGAASDHDGENGATSTTVTFWSGSAVMGNTLFVQCQHDATYRGVNYHVVSNLSYYIQIR